jgi:hypothetical protein
MSLPTAWRVLGPLLFLRSGIRLGNSLRRRRLTSHMQSAVAPHLGAVDEMGCGEPSMATTAATAPALAEKHAARFEAVGSHRMLSDDVV